MRRRIPGPPGGADRPRPARLALALAVSVLFLSCTAINRQVRFNPPPGEVSGTGFCLPIETQVTSPFGRRELGGKGAFHNGVDFAGRMLVTPVFAARGGLVSIVAKSRTYGLWIEIQHAGGWVTRYAHLSWQHARQGQQVRRGDLIGRIGSTGRSTGTHLHFEVRHNGTPVDPFSVLPGGGAPDGVPRVRLLPGWSEVALAGTDAGDGSW